MSLHQLIGNSCGPFTVCHHFRQRQLHSKKNNNNVLKAIVAYRTEIHPWNGNKTHFGNINSPRLLPQILHWPQITPPIVPTGGLPAPIQTQLLTFTALFKLHFLFDCVCSSIVRMRESEDDTCMSKSKGNS